MKPPTVSVLMAAYNRERYIGPAIESVLAQTYGDFELLVVDDCSTDGTVGVARRYESDRRVRVVVNERRLGQFPNRNRAAGLAAGRYLKFHDSDDLMYPHCLATMVEFIEAEPRAGFALSSGWGWPGGPCPMFLTPHACYQREFLGPGMFFCGPAGAIFRREVFHELGGFVDQGVGSDHLFWLRACARVNVLLVPGDLFWYRVHPQQEFHSRKAAADYAIVHGEVWRMLHGQACPLRGAELEQAKRNAVWSLAKATWRDVKAGSLSIARLRLKLAGLSWRDWLRYFRRQRRDLFAGTPLDEAGQFLIPGWLRAAAQPGPARVGNGSRP